MMTPIDFDSDFSSGPSTRRVLLVGASRGLGLALAEEWARRDWHVTATVRSTSRMGGTGLHDLKDRYPTKIAIEVVDITVPEQIHALHHRLGQQTFDVLFVNAGVTNQPEETVAEASTDEFVRVMVTNALAPLRVIEAFQDHVESDGTIGVMSSGAASVSMNDRGGNEVYRGSKAALSTFMRSYAARHQGEQRSLILMSPGWVKTEMGGPDAPLSINDSIPHVVDTIETLRNSPGLRFVDYLGRSVPW